MPKFKAGDYVIDTAIKRGILCVWKIITYNETQDTYVLSTEVDESILGKEHGSILISKRATVESSVELTGSNWKLLYG